ncbi:monovalent cation/H+ antiporter subunit D family protein [Phytoactinopolyspora limicola]|uniref:monovalent cation/H+ antiporter subunit D family protein n=1 Tax=Phytoactinopolyspora limicola TaxID=2715536 RepID=UPI001A9C61CC|nr:monovalent cation/H+ antiporter subunit D family protein [Phytoactinopolyspora limicola]
MNNLLPLVVGVPLLAAAVSPMTKRRLVLRRLLLLGTPAAVLTFGVLLVIETRDGDVVAEQVASWDAGISIAFAADLFSALVLVVMSLLTLVCSMFLSATGEDEDPLIVPLVLVLSGGVFGALLTADLFNLFVMIEVALLPSYVLISKSLKTPALAAGRIYLTVSLLGSSILLGGIAFVYAVNGSVHLGELAGAGHESGVAAFAGGVILIALGLKGALVPMHGWLPRTYPYASPAITALFSGLLTKIGIYGLFRVFSVYFEGASQVQGIILAITVTTMVVGVFGALGENNMRAILAFHMVSQVGYIALGLGFFGVAGMAAAIFYLLHHTVVKASLFLSAGAIETQYGTDRLAPLGGMARREPILAVSFFIAALSLAGIPPFSGFIAKFTLIRAAMDEGEYLAGGIAAAVSIFTLLSMLKIWNAVFWGAPSEVADQPGRATTVMVDTDVRIRRALIIPGALLALVTISLGLGAEVLLPLAQTAAEGLVDTSAYVQAVLGR